MVPRPLEEDPSGPDRNEPPALARRPRGGFGRRVYPASAPAAAAAVAPDRVSLRIEDGLLMAFGPDGDPLPPAAFIAAVQDRPATEVRLNDGTAVAPLRAAAVLEAQAAKPLSAATTGAAADGWIRSMLGLGPQPEMTPADELQGEQRVCELTAFARELMISMPAGGTFLITEATDQAAATAGLLLADGERVSVARLIERIRAEVGPSPAAAPGAVGQPGAEIALPECRIQVAGKGLLLALPAVGAVRLVELDGADPAAGPRVGIFLANGVPAAVADLVGTLAHAGLADGADGAADMTAERAPASDHAAGGTMALSLELPEIIDAAADGSADLGVLGEALGKGRAVLASATVHGMPEGAVLSAGRQEDDGSWHLAAEDLRGLRLRLPAQTPGDCVLQIAVRTAQGEAARTITVRRPGRAAAAVPGAMPAAPAAEAPAGAAAAGAAPIRLAVRPPTGHGVDPKHVALVIIGGLPPGAALSAGLDNGDGSWMLSAADLVGLELSVPAGCATDITLEVTALAVTSREGGIARAADRLRLSLDPLAQPLPLVIDPAAARGLQALMIRDLPRSARLSAGTYDPAIDAWVVLPRQLDGLSVIRSGGTAACTLTVTGVALGADGRAETRLVGRLPLAAG